MSSNTATVGVKGKVTKKRTTSGMENQMKSKKNGGIETNQAQTKKAYKTGSQSTNRNHVPVSQGKVSKHSSVLMERRNGCTHESVFLRVSPISSDAGEPQCQVLPSSPQSDMNRFFASERIISGQQGRRETVCQETDEFAKERVVVRVLMKKF